MSWLAIILAMTLSALAGACLAEREWRRMIIRRGFARWHPTKRTFQWRMGDGWEGEL